MRVAIIYNQDRNNVINAFGMQNKEVYNPQTVKRVAIALEKGGHNVEIIDGNMNVIENIRDFLPKVQEGEKYGLVFNMAYGIQGESRYTHIPAMLEMLGIPYVGSSPSGHAVALDKVITKIILQKNNIPTPDFWVFSSDAEDMSDVKFPVIVKPKMESVSFGLKVVYNIEELRDAVKFVTNEFKQQALVEKFIRGREFAVGLVGNNPVEIFPVLEIDLEGDPDAIQTVDDKQKKPRTKICPAKISDELAEKMKDLSLKVFKVLGLRDFSRVDIRLDEDNNIYILEVNSMASLGMTGSYVTAANVHGYDFTKLVNKILEVASIRYFTDQFIDPHIKSSKSSLPLSIRLRSYLRNNQENTLKLLEEIVNINTYIKNIDGVNRLGNIIRKELIPLDFSHEIIYQSEVGNMHFFNNCDHEDVDFLIISNLDNSNRLNTHKYFKATEHKYFGTGIWENKGGLIVLLMALKSLKYARLLKKLKIGILLTTDDTFQGSFSKNIIKKKAIDAKYVLGMHGGFIDGGMVTSRSGSAFYNLDMTLKDAANHFDVAKATNVFSKLISDWTKLSSEEDGIIVNPRRIEFKSKITEPYVHGEIGLSVRFKNNYAFEELDSKIRKAIPYKKYKSTLEFQLEGGMKRPSMEKHEKVIELMKNINVIAKDLDIRVKSEHRWSSADICLMGNDKYALDGFGPNGIKETNNNEYILKHTLTEKALILAMLLNQSID